jgi:hypothetical protein
MHGVRKLDTTLLANLVLASVGCFGGLVLDPSKALMLIPLYRAIELEQE